MQMLDVTVSPGVYCHPEFLEFLKDYALSLLEKPPVCDQIALIGTGEDLANVLVDYNDSVIPKSFGVDIKYFDDSDELQEMHLEVKLCRVSGDWLPEKKKVYVIPIPSEKITYKHFPYSDNILNTIRDNEVEVNECYIRDRPEE